MDDVVRPDLTETGATRPAPTVAGGGAAPATPDPTAIVGHELRGPLGALLAFADMLVDRLGERPEERRLAELVRIAGAQALGIADDLVDAASLSAGRFRTHDAAFSPAGLVRRTAELYAPLARLKHARISVEVAADVPDLVVSDERRIAQILTNFIQNALKHAAASPVRLSLRRGPAAGTLWFEVADDGPGPAEAARLAPFAARPADRPPLEGAGIGLWISARIAAELGAGIRILDGKPGTRAVLETAPLVVAVPPATTRNPPLVPGTPAPGLALDGLSVPARGAPYSGRLALVVDDSAVSLSLTTALLASFGFEVVTARSAAEAEIVAARRMPDVVLIDWSLVGETGADVADRLVRAFGAQLPPMVAVTGIDRLPADRRFRAALRKPFAPRDLYDMLGGVLGRGIASGGAG
ncbi:hybrid sensor histidine kinase/response regulator [Methylobrevis albus]|uniref:histidine kinase n=1 Tax=Methylobrevis albus TaxID=2793297 RepID=A0A931MWW5_9HYPH|nr:hybrid sensor histidine kinase/response regulator [Methylobrevis albus]MBH0238013.1 response regulator [Methylobrevis albus]